MNSAYSITSKFQVTIPKQIREELGITDKNKLNFKKEGKRVYIEKVPTLDEVAAEMSEIFRKSGRKPVTAKEMKNARDIFYKEGGKW